MGLDAARLSLAIKTGMLANPNSYAVDNPALTAMCDEIAQAVIAEIVSFGVVLPLLLVAPPGGGPVTGTGTIA